jgi:hypothetical protein
METKIGGIKKRVRRVKITIKTNRRIEKERKR